MTATDSVRVRKLALEQFRIHTEFSVDIPEGGLRIHGPNGSGKTTLLEAIQLLSTTRPRRGAIDSDLIHHASGVDLGLPPYARAVGTFDRAGAVAKVEAYIQRGTRSGTARKTLKVGDRARRAGDVVGLVPTVSFSPDDLELLLGTPSTRRRFLDVLLSQVNRQYLRCLSKYAKILTQRNGLLRQIGTGSAESGSPEQFAFWDEQLIALGSYLLAVRVRTVHDLASSASIRFQELSPSVGSLGIAYRPTIEATSSWWDSIVHEASDNLDAAQRIGTVFERRLRETRELEIARGATMIGPHRDDFSVTLAEHEISRFGSRGQQRVAVIAIKLAEIDVISKSTNLRPIFLIDDVLSELDAIRQASLINAVAHAGSQIIVTSTDELLLAESSLSSAGSLSLGTR